ncbi:uncharacterized protein [Diabrotica undecimpunctata]|uniref:uncharacterized protein n=1 Tax=Diabrotica undecimpunctata TaxID=50387 RepID=UPI003B63BB9C
MRILQYIQSSGVTTKLCLYCQFIVELNQQSKWKDSFAPKELGKKLIAQTLYNNNNRHTDSVDLQDSLLGLYPIKIKSKKWHHSNFYQMLNVAVVNAWLLDRRIKKQIGKTEEIIQLLNFKTILAEQLTNSRVLQTRKVGQPRSSTPEQSSKRRCIEPIYIYVQTDQFSHWSN